MSGTMQEPSSPFEKLPYDIIYNILWAIVHLHPTSLTKLASVSKAVQRVYNAHKLHMTSSASIVYAGGPLSETLGDAVLLAEQETGLKCSELIRLPDGTYAASGGDVADTQETRDNLEARANKNSFILSKAVWVNHGKIQLFTRFLWALAFIQPAHVLKLKPLDPLADWQENIYDYAVEGASQEMIDDVWEPQVESLYYSPEYQLEGNILRHILYNIGIRATWLRDSRAAQWQNNDTPASFAEVVNPITHRLLGKGGWRVAMWLLGVSKARVEEWECLIAAGAYDDLGEGGSKECAEWKKWIASEDGGRGRYRRWIAAGMPLTNFAE